MALENVSLEEMESLATLSKSLADNPATRRQFLNLVKQASPETSIPEIDIENRFYSNAKPLVDEVNSLKNQLAERDFKQTVKENRAKLLNYGIPADKVGEVETMMVNSKIGDYDTAAKFYLSTQEAATPTPASFSSPMTLPNMSDMGDPKKWALQTAHEAVNDIIRSRGR